MKKYYILVIVIWLCKNAVSQPQCIINPNATITFVSSSGGNCTYNLSMAVTSTQNGTKAVKFSVLNAIPSAIEVCRNNTVVVDCVTGAGSQINDGTTISHTITATVPCISLPSLQITGTTSNTLFNNVCVPILIVTANNSPNPVKLSYFRGLAKPNEIALTWQTEAETNSSHFVVQRSVNAVEFGDLEKINSAGESIEKINYKFTDKNPFPGINYYRLRQVDNDGSINYSKIIDVNAEGGVSETIIYPNPSVGRFMIKTKEPILASEAFNSTGKYIEFKLDKQGNSYSVNFEKTPESGLYFLKVRTQSGITNYRIVIQ